MISWEAVTSECARPYRGGPVPKGTIQIFNDETTESMPVPQAVARYIRGSKQFGETPYTSVQELKDAVRAVTGMVARSRALRMLERRDYSYKELLVRLTNEGFDKATCVSILNDMRSSGVLDDTRFAEVFIRSKLSSGWGIERIRRELASRGVDTERLPGWPYDYADPDDEFERAMGIASRKRVREPNAYAKLVRFLMGRGFSTDVSMRAAKQTLMGD